VTCVPSPVSWRNSGTFAGEFTTNPRYAPIIRSSPCAKFGTPAMLYTSESPIAPSAMKLPVTIPFRIAFSRPVLTIVSFSTRRPY